MKTALRLVAVLLLLIVVAGLVFYTNPLWVSDSVLRFKLWRQGVKSEYINAGGYSFHYFEAKPVQGEGMPLLLVHGLGAPIRGMGEDDPGDGRTRVSRVRS